VPAVALVSGNVLVTGASGGIGHAIARALAARGAKLTLSGRRADVLEPLAREVRGRAVACDLSDRQATVRLAREAGEVDVLVANAALPASGELSEFTQEQVDRVLEVNLRAPIALAHALAPGMGGRGRGHLVFISSLSGKSANPASSLYSATKFGLRGFALSLREDLRRDGIGVSVVLPGFIRDAGMFAEAAVELPRGVGTRTPEDVAEGVIAAIEHNHAEVEVAPLSLRLGASFASLAPGLSATLARRLGSERVSRDLAEGQRHKR
jgi:short-subunit dehydrogenase